jgi:hypothetical protein
MSRVVSVTEEPSVFISYSKQDQVIARRLVQDLHAKGISVWFDEDEIRPGDLIVERITEALLLLARLTLAQCCWLPCPEY